MKRKITLAAASLLLIAGTASASSLNGNYKGDPIVKVMNNGKALTVEDVPAVVHDHRTLVPLYMLKQMNMDVQWNQDNYTVELKNNSAMTWGEYHDFSNQIEAYRALFFIQDQFSLMYILITTLALEKPTSAADIDYIKQQADKIDFTAAEEIIDGFNFWKNMDPLDVQNFKNVIDYLKQSKEYISQLDGSNANIQMVKAQTLFTSLATKYETETFDTLKSKNDAYSASGWAN